jgi:hypothetical protein
VKGHLIGVFGPFNSRALVEVSADTAAELVDEELIDPAPVFIIDAVRRDLEAIGSRDADLAESALAMTALTLAYEMASPANSATSKAMCAGQLRDTLARLRELAPPEQKASGLDDLKRDRSLRLVGGSASPD